MNEQFVIIVNSPPTDEATDMSGFVAYGPYSSEEEAEAAMSVHWDVDLRYIVMAELQSPEALVRRAQEEGISK